MKVEGNHLGTINSITHTNDSQFEQIPKINIELQNYLSLDLSRKSPQNYMSNIFHQTGQMSSVRNRPQTGAIGSSFPKRRTFQPMQTKSQVNKRNKSFLPGTISNENVHGIKDSSNAFSQPNKQSLIISRDLSTHIGSNSLLNKKQDQIKKNVWNPIQIQHKNFA